jgi:hypothetical protein
MLVLFVILQLGVGIEAPAALGPPRAIHGGAGPGFRVEHEGGPSTARTTQALVFNQEPQLIEKQ